MSSTATTSNRDKNGLFPLERIISVEDLAEIILNDSTTNRALNSKPPRFSLFLGAGASMSSKIKVGRQMIRDFVETIFAKERKYRKENKDSESIENEEIDLNNSKKSDKEREEPEEIIFKKKKEFLKKLYRYDNDEGEYSFFFRLRYQKEVDRRDYIRSIIEPADVSWGYIQLANLIESGIFRNILTTNFDDLVYQTCTSFTDTRPIVFSYGNLATEVTFSSDRPQIFKLHGDFLYTSLKNLYKEINEEGSSSANAKAAASDPALRDLQDKVNMREAFKQSLKDRSGIVAIGYAGADKSIMEIFEELPITHYLLWCIRWNEDDDKTPLTWGWLEENHGNKLADLLEKRDGYIVKIKGFDDVMSTICKVAEIEDNDIIFTAIKRITKLRNKLYNFKREPINETPDTDKTEKERLKDFKKKIDTVLLATSYFFLGYDYYLEGDDVKAECSYKKSIEKYKKFGDVYFNYGNLLAKDYERHLEAEDKYNKAIELNPSDAYAHNRLGLLLTNNPFKLKEAKSYIEKAIELKPNYDFAHYNLGNWFLKSGYEKQLSGDTKESESDFKEAKVKFEKASEINKKSVEYLISLVAVLNNLLEIDESSPEKDEIPKLKDKIQELKDKINTLIKDHDFYNRACFYSVTGEKDEAIKYLEKAIIKNKQNVSKAMVDLNFNLIKDDPRFEEIIDKYKNRK